MANPRPKPSRIYNTWNAMIARCTRPSDKRWKHYGGRGITVCERWRTFANFAVDMSPRPAGMTLDRIDTNGNYEPANCRWITNTEQQRNRRNTRLTPDLVIEIKARLGRGEVQRMIAESVGVSQSAISRVATGDIWSEQI